MADLCLKASILFFNLKVQNFFWVEIPTPEVARATQRDEHLKYTFRAAASKCGAAEFLRRKNEMIRRP